MSNDITSVKQRQDAIPNEIASISVAQLQNPTIDFLTKYKVKIPMTTLEEFRVFEEKLKTNINLRNDVVRSNSISMRFDLKNRWQKKFTKILILYLFQYLELRTHIDKNHVISKTMVRMLRRFLIKDLANMFTAVRSSKINKNKVKFKPTELCMMIDGKRIVLVL